jgi:uncharacterized phage protein (TIGR01671 family)
VVAVFVFKFMREIKFRAWDKTTLSMFWSLHESVKDSPNWNSVFWGKIDADPDNYDVMQYTGLKDKNGKQIYEGDVIEYVEYHRPEPDSSQLFVVSYNNGGFYLSSLEDNEYDDDLGISPVEVVGNIYENPELLK